MLKLGIDRKLGKWGRGEGKASGYYVVWTGSAMK
jgi:hypothetical protein